MKTDSQSMQGERNHRIAQLVRGAMDRNGFKSIGAFAERAGIARATAYHLVASGTPPQPSLETLFKLESALEIPASELIELFRPIDQSALEQQRLAALEGLRGKYAGPISLSAQLHDERRAERL